LRCSKRSARPQDRWLLLQLLPRRITMQAWSCNCYSGDPFQTAKHLVCDSKTPIPTPGPRQLQIKVRYAAVDPLDWMLISGAHKDRFPVAFPFTPGFDAAGEVTALGPGCSGDIKVGDRVVCCLGVQESVCGKSPRKFAGTFAEFCVCPEDQATTVPDPVHLHSVAGLPLAGLTAYQALFTGNGSSTLGEPLGAIAGDSRLLILGGNRGPGHLALQLAKAVGASVTVTVPPSCMDWMRELGADEVVNFRESHWVETMAGRGFDLILDCVGWATTVKEMDRAAVALRRGGQLISTSNFEAFEKADASVLRHGCEFKAMLPKVAAEDLDILVHMVSVGKLKVTVDQVVVFADACHALRESVVGQCRGKVLLCQCNAGARGACGGA